jgi:hypothetical protein
MLQSKKGIVISANDWLKMQVEEWMKAAKTTSQFHISTPLNWTKTGILFSFDSMLTILSFVILKTCVQKDRWLQKKIIVHLYSAIKLQKYCSKVQCFLLIQTSEFHGSWSTRCSKFYSNMGRRYLIFFQTLCVA